MTASLECDLLRLDFVSYAMIISSQSTDTSGREDWHEGVTFVLQLLVPFVTTIQRPRLAWNACVHAA